MSKTKTKVKKSVKAVKKTAKKIIKKDVSAKIKKAVKKVAPKRLKKVLLKSSPAAEPKIYLKDLFADAKKTETEMIPATTAAYSLIFPSVAVAEPQEEPAVEPEEEIPLTMERPAAWKKAVLVVGVITMSLLIGTFWLQITRAYFGSLEAQQEPGLTEQITLKVSQDLKSLSTDTSKLKQTLGDGLQKIQEQQAKNDAAATPATGQ